MGLARSKWGGVGLWTLTRAEADYPESVRRCLGRDGPSAQPLAHSLSIASVAVGRTVNSALSRCRQRRCIDSPDAGKPGAYEPRSKLARDRHYRRMERWRRELCTGVGRILFAQGSHVQSL